jgi:hypothetical protein
MNGEIWPVTQKNFNNLSLKKKVEILKFRKTLNNTIEHLLSKPPSEKFLNKLKELL